MIENAYLLYANYGIKETDTQTDMITKAAEKSFKDFCRRVSYQQKVPIDRRTDMEREVENLLSTEIQNLLHTASQSNATQDRFDSVHHRICEAVLRVYDTIGGIPYGIAQRWLNLTLLNMVVIESTLAADVWPICNIRHFFHAPVDMYVLEAAASNNRSHPFQNGLSLKAAPIQHEDGAISLDWFIAGKTLPFEHWDYDLYRHFQTAIRERLQPDIANGTYQDVLDWSMKAYLEVIARRIR